MELTQNELNERVAVLKRFRRLLEEQRAKFAQYLKVLELQENGIQNEDTDALIAHTELETQIVSNIHSLQKVIMPLESLYNSYRTTFSPNEAVPVTDIQNELEVLQKKVLAQNEKNRELLKTHMNTLRVQIQNFRNPYKSARSVYAKNTATAGTRIAIEV